MAVANREIDEVYINQLEATLGVFQERIAELEFAREDFGWVRLSGDRNHEFSIDHLKRIVARSRLFFLQNPLINRAVTLQADYVFAQGVNIQATSKIVNEVIQDFIDDVQNTRELTSHQARLMKEQTLMLDGNVFFVLFTDKLDTGTVQIRSILVDEIVDIITNPDDMNDVWFYKRQWQSRNPTDYQTESKTAFYPDMNYQGTPNEHGQLPMNVDGAPIYWDAPIYHRKVGGLAKSRFGVPEVYSALDWAQAHRKMLEDWATIIQAYARFAFKLTTPGNKNSIVSATRKLGTTISPGSAVEHNPIPEVGSIFATKKDGVDIEPLRTSGATTSAKDSRELRIMVAAAVGLPDPMLSGEVDVGNLATAKTLDRPTELKFKSRQELWATALKDILGYVIKWSVMAPNGILSKYVKFTIDNRGRVDYVAKNDPKTGKPIDLHLEVTFPPILEHTIIDRIDAITNAVTLNGKTIFVDSPELQKLTIRLQLQALGLADVDEIVERIVEDIVKSAADPNTPPVNVDPNQQPNNNNPPGDNNGTAQVTKNDANTKPAASSHANG